MRRQTGRQLNSATKKPVRNGCNSQNELLGLRGLRGLFGRTVSSTRRAHEESTRGEYAKRMEALCAHRLANGQDDGGVD